MMHDPSTNMLVPARLREAVSVRQARVIDLAGRIGVSPDLMRGWLDGTARPDAAQLLRLSVLLDVTPAFLARERRGDGLHCFHRAAPQMGERCWSEMESLLLWLGDVREAIGDELQQERPGLLSSAVELAVAEGGVGRREIVEATGLSPGDVENLCGLPGGWLDDGNVVPLRGERSRLAIRCSHVTS